jgi:hypothetical protein
MSYISKTFSSVADALGNAKYIDDIAEAVGRGAKTTADLDAAKALYKADILASFDENTTLKSAFNNLLGDATQINDNQFIKIMSALPEGAADDLFEAGSDAARRANRLLGAGGSTDGALGAAITTADDINIDDINDLNKLNLLSKQDRRIVMDQLVDKYSVMSPEALKLEGDKFFEAGDDGIRAFKKLPSQIQADIAIANPRLRWKAGQSPAGFQWIKGACKNYPVMCAVGAAGGIVGAGFAAEEVYNEVLDDKSEEIRSCIATCLPEDYYSSEVSGYGTTEYKDLKFRTIDDIKTATGNDDITADNTPLCTAAMDPPKCPEMCAERCEDLHESFLKRLLRGAGELAAGAAGAAGGAAGSGLSAFLDGFFGEGMGMPSMIAIIIVFIVIIILST